MYFYFTGDLVAYFADFLDFDLDLEETEDLSAAYLSFLRNLRNEGLRSYLLLGYGFKFGHYIGPGFSFGLFVLMF